jgi:hypothetical protein
MVKRKTTKTLSRAEQLREEAKRAAEYGQTPKRPLSLAPRFRVEERTPTAFSAGSTMLPTYDVAARNDADFQIGVTASALRKASIDVPAVGALETKVLHEVIRANAELLGPENRDQIVPRLLSQVRALAAQAKDGKRIAAVQKRISKAMFGPVEFKDIKGKKGGADSCRS